MGNRSSLDIDPVPQPYGGVETVKCVACKWEAVFIVPEESTIMMSHVLQHIVHCHEIDMPVFMCHTH